MIKNVIFDIGNVLGGFCWYELMVELGLPENVREIFKETIFTSHWWRELDYGLQEESEIVPLMREDNKDYYKEFDLVWENRDKLVDAYDYAIPWIEELKSRGYKVYLLSNYPRDLFKLHEDCGRLPFVNNADGKVVSGYVKMVKPDADIYEYLVDKFGLKMEECVFIDDLENNVGTARALGMKGIVFKSYEQASQELNAILVRE